MTKNILILSGSPKKNGNTAALMEWFMEGAGSKNAKIEVIHAAFLQYKFPGCTSCRSCQKQEAYECVIDDDANLALRKMAAADVIVMATPLYFFAASAQLKVLIDRMFSLYKWDNAAGTMRTVLKGKTLVLLGSAYEDVGLDAMEKPFMLTADYSGMEYESLLVTNAGESGDIRKRSDIREKAVAFGQKFA
jgi:multimeric flavodoxin WrbA